MAYWEAIADSAPNKLLHSKGLPEVSKLSVEDKKSTAPKRRGRGTFSYKKHELYSDQLQDCLSIDKDGNSEPQLNLEETAGVKHCKSYSYTTFSQYLWFINLFSYLFF